MDEQKVQFIAMLDDWVVVKKLKIEPGLQNHELIEFLLSIQQTLANKVKKLVESELNCEQLRKAVDEALKSGTNAWEILEHSAVKKALRDVLKKDYDKKIAKFLKELASIYALDYALEKSKVKHSFSDAELPTLKLAKKLGKRAK